MAHDPLASRPPLPPHPVATPLRTFYVKGVDELRDVIARARPGQKMFIAIDGSTSFNEVKQFWEAVTLEENAYELANVEALLFKHEAGVFVSEKIAELKEWEEALAGQIGTMKEWVQTMEGELASGGPYVASDYMPIVLRGPDLFLDVSKIGVVDADTNREKIRKEFEYYGGAVPSRTESSYWSSTNAIARQLEENRSMLKLNIHILSIKIQALSTFKEMLAEGANSLSKIWEEPTHMGCADTALLTLHDIEMLDIKRARDTKVDEGKCKRARGDGADAMDMDEA